MCPCTTWRYAQRLYALSGMFRTAWCVRTQGTARPRSVFHNTTMFWSRDPFVDEIRLPLLVDRFEPAQRAEHLRDLPHVTRKGAGEARRVERAARGPHAGALGRGDAELELLAQRALEDGADVARVPAAAVLVRVKVGEQDLLHRSRG